MLVLICIPFLDPFTLAASPVCEACQFLQIFCRVLQDESTGPGHITRTEQKKSTTLTLNRLFFNCYKATYYFKDPVLIQCPL